MGKKTKAAQDQNGAGISKTTKLVKEYSTAVPLEFSSEVNFNEDESGFVTFLIQTKALCWKNWLIFRRKNRLFIFMVLTPCFVGWLLDLITAIAFGLHNSGIVDFEPEDIGQVQTCQVGRHPGWTQPTECLTVAYGFIGNSTDVNAPQYGRYHELMDVFTENNKFQKGKDVRAVTAGGQTDMMNYLVENQNKTLFAVMFCQDYWEETLEMNTYGAADSEKMFNFDLDDSERGPEVKKEKLEWYMPCKFEEDKERDMWTYYIIYNMTLGPSNLYTAMDKPMNKNSWLMALKLSIDNSILEVKARQEGLDWTPKINQTLQHFPYIPDRLFLDFDVITMYGSFYVIMVPLCAFMIFFDELIREKCDNLRKGLQVLGTQDNAYWASWIICGSIMNMVMAAEMVVIGKYYYAFDAFTRCPGYVWFLVLFMTAETYICMASFFVTVVNTKTQAFTVNFGVVLCSMVANIVLCEPTIIKKVFFNLDMPPWVGFATSLFYLNPCFQFGKLFGDITNRLCTHFDPLNVGWVKSEHEWEFEDLWYEDEGVFISKDRYRVTSMVGTGWTLVYVGSFFSFLAWYFDHTLSQNRGVGKPWTFFIMPSFWCPPSRNKATSSTVHYDDKTVLGKVASLNTAISEKQNIMKQENDGNTEFNGIRVMGLSKTYQSIVSGADIHALKQVFFELKKGELLGVMGHNGAGKSTLINAICGLVHKDSGNARIFDSNIEDDLVMIRKRLGVVSQFDVLWDELTGIEHMQLYQVLKRVDIADLDKLIAQRLDDVGLTDAGSLTVGKYSGGMRRRMSVALSTMGNPNLILMDEPTTGMDPVSRRHVWTLIQRLKTHKAIIMSTHAMEEAEILSDKLIVLNDGVLKCVGSPLELKKMLGKGYRINMICKQNDIKQVLLLVKQIMPSSHFLESSGESGGLVFSLAIENVKELGPIFSLIDIQKLTNQQDKLNKAQSSSSKLAKMVTDVGVSQTTLEEVFMTVSAAKE